MAEATLDHEDGCKIAVTVTVRHGASGTVKTCIICGATETDA